MSSNEFASAPPIKWICPNCFSGLSKWVSDVLTCAACGAVFTRRNRIYHFLAPNRLAQLQPFLAQYRYIREQDGYRQRPPSYYRALPLAEDQDPQAAIWRVRRSSFQRLRQWLQRQFSGRRIVILDLGAGNGWLSHCLAALGHSCVAVDLNDDAEDGLGAHVHYPVSFICVQADFDRLPFAPRQFDLVLFNASLHYSANTLSTLEHACRLLLPGGALAIMDSPTFKTESSGRQMQAQIEAHYKRRYQLSDFIHPGKGFLTVPGLAQIGEALQINFQSFASSGGWLWDLRSRVAGLKLRREPANFGVWIGQK